MNWVGKYFRVNSNRIDKGQCAQGNKEFGLVDRWYQFCLGIITLADGTGTPVKDGLVEIWQVGADGRYGSSAEGFVGWGRSATDLDTGYFRFDTIKPGAVAMPDGRMQAPHISVWIAARGVNLGLHTRLYFPDEAEANAADPLLSRLEHQSRVQTLIARREGGKLIFDIRLQGENETVFLDI